MTHKTGENHPCFWYSSGVMEVLSTPAVPVVEDAGEGKDRSCLLCFHVFTRFHSFSL